MGYRERKTHQPTNYLVEIGGHLQGDWVDWFGGMAVTSLFNGNTMLTGQIEDQAALHGLINKVFSLGLSLIAINQEVATNEKKGVL